MAKIILSKKVPLSPKGTATCPFCGAEVKLSRPDEGIGVKTGCPHLFLAGGGKAIFRAWERVFWPQALEDKYSSLGGVKGAVEDISFHRNHGEFWGYFFPGTLAGWGEVYDGGWIDYHRRSYYFTPVLIREGVKRQVKENRRWSRRRWIQFWREHQGEVSLQGASGRMFQLRR